MKTIKRDLYAKKPRDNADNKFPRERSLIDLVKRCQSLERSYDYAEPIYKVTPILPSGEIVYDQIYYECHMVTAVGNFMQLSQKNKREILMLNLHGEVLRGFDSVIDAATFLINKGYTKSLSIAGTGSTISKRAQKGKSYLGYKWKYASEGDLL